MSSDTSKTVAKRNASTALMPPPPAPKRIKRPSVVLDEDTYTSAISHIIRRDFFPGLAETDAQREYLSALDSKDKRWIREAGKKLTEVMTPVPGRSSARNTRFKSGVAPGANGGMTPSTWGADTPRTETGGQEDEEDEEGLGKLDKVDLDMSLNAFQAKYTSEDQESFNQLLDTQNRKRFEKHAWLHDGNRYASKQRIAQQKVIEARRQAATDDNNMAVAVRPSQDLDDRPAAPNTHKHTAFNNLMFEPEGVEGWAPTRAQAAQDASLAPPKRVLHANTRMPVPTPNDHPPRSSSPTRSAILDAVSGRPRLTASEGGFTGNETPRVNGYAFVDARAPSPPPSPTPDSEEEDAPTDLLERFGATSTTTASPFTISDSQRREKLHFKMVDKISASKRSTSSSSSTTAGGNVRGGGGGAAAKTPSHGLGLFTSETPRFASAPTPAAMRLLQRQRRGGGGERQGGMTPVGQRKVGSLTPAAQRLLMSVHSSSSSSSVKIETA
ncbi:hypothetical protein DM02DRAFT_492043, partial [Periconia macrospinosa]